MRKIQFAYKKSPYSRQAVCTGDSLTLNFATGVRPTQYWAEVLAGYLRDSGCTIIARNYGISGDTTSGMIGRATAIGQFGTPDLGIVWGGTNDPIGGISVFTLVAVNTTVTLTSTRPFYMPTGSSIVTAGWTPSAFNGTFTVTQTGTFTWTFTAGTTSGTATGGTATWARSQAQIQAQLQALVKSYKFGCVGAVDVQADLPAGSTPGTRLVVFVDSSSTGGVAGVGAQTPTITGAGGNAQTVWECRTNNAGETGWGRVATVSTTPDHCLRILMMGNHYLNFSSGGDTTSSTPLTAVYAEQIAAQTAAATAESVPYVDNFNYIKNLILSGVEVQGSFSTQCADGNVHFSRLGHQYIARNSYGVIASQSGWLGALTQQ